MILCREELAKDDQPRGLPGPAGRPADAHHRRQGGGAEDRADGAVPRPPAPDDRQRAGVRRRPDRRRRRRAHRRHRRPPGARRPDPTGLDGKTAEERLEEVGITVNRNAIPFDERPPMNPSGLRIGTPALTTRGLGEDDMREIAEVIAVALSDRFEAEREALGERTRALMERYPLYPQLAAPHAGLSRPPPPRGRCSELRGAAAGDGCSTARTCTCPRSAGKHDPAAARVEPKRPVDVAGPGRADPQLRRRPSRTPSSAARSESSVGSNRWIWASASLPPPSISPGAARVDRRPGRSGER